MKYVRYSKHFVKKLSRQCLRFKHLNVKVQNIGARINSGRNRIGANRLRVNHAPVPHNNGTIRTRHVGLGFVFTDFWCF